MTHTHHHISASFCSKLTRINSSNKLFGHLVAQRCEQRERFQSLHHHYLNSAFEPLFFLKSAMPDDNKAPETQSNQTKSCFSRTSAKSSKTSTPKVFSGRTEKAPHCQLEPLLSVFESHMVKHPGSRPCSYSNTNN